MNRVIPYYEKRQRGCQYCLHMSLQKTKGYLHTACPFNECPYTVLDKYKTFEEFMKSEDSKILVNEFFSTVASCYELQSRMTPNRSFSDGDSRVGI